MNSTESKTLIKGEKIEMIVTGGSGRVYHGEIIATDDNGNTIRWDDGEIGTVEHQFADYLRRPEANMTSAS
jgi:hypothetical protein